MDKELRCIDIYIYAPIIYIGKNIIYKYERRSAAYGSCRLAPVASGHFRAPVQREQLEWQEQVRAPSSKWPEELRFGVEAARDAAGESAPAAAA